MIMDSADAYCPPLPPGFKQDLSKIVDVKQKQNEKKILIGPECSLNILKTQSGPSDSSKQEKLKTDDSDVIGPSPPSWLLKNQSSDSSSSESEIGYGPMPTKSADANDVNDIVANVEKRAKDMKRKLDGNDVPVEKLEREEWMTVPNTSSKNQLGVISKCLSHGASRSHRNKESKHYKSSKEERKLAKELEKYNKSKRSESLLDMHHKSKKKKKKDEDKRAERKPFNRDEDMSLRMMDKNQVKSVIDKAKFLDSRFSRGQSKYL